MTTTTINKHCAGGETASVPPSLSEPDLMKWPSSEPELTPDQEVAAALDYLENDRSGSVHLTSPLTNRLVQGDKEKRMTRIVLEHLRTCSWCSGVLRDALHLGDVPADHPACALLSQIDPWFAEAQNGLDRLREIPGGWDGDGAEAPNDTAIINTQCVLTVLQRMSFRPNRIAPSAEGGVMLSFFAGKRYGDIEMFNTGKILAINSDRVGSPHIWEVATDETSITSALGIIRDYIAIKPEQQLPTAMVEHKTCLSETQALILPEHEYDAVQALIGSRREPNGEVKKVIERLRKRTW